MKIRIKGNFIRYRLVQHEVLTLSKTGRLLETTCFGPMRDQVFSYALESKEGITGLQAAFDGRTITLYLPVEDAHAWPAGERVGFENSIEVAPGVVLHLLLEKDFVCLEDVSEDQSDNYPNPRLARPAS